MRHLVRFRRPAPALVVGVFVLALAGPVDARPTLQLRWVDGYPACAGLREVAVRELEGLLDRLAVDVEWSTEEMLTPSELGKTLRIVILPPALVERFRAREGAMGSVRGSGDRRRVVYVFTPAIMRALGLPVTAETCRTPPDSLEVARAVARVVLHELVHAIVPSREHSDSGIMQASLSRSALLHGEDLDDACRRAFLDGLRQPPPRTTAQ